MNMNRRRLCWSVPASSSAGRRMKECNRAETSAREATSDQLSCGPTTRHQEHLDTVKIVAE